ncbi:hypothetical protein GKC32_01320 [Lactobacillus curvatus]|nr:hypothetical protein [Latilactobacillus curvatus]MSE23113.1 hypothetical protein [Latilactobacillus curvatus]
MEIKNIENNNWNVINIFRLDDIKNYCVVRTINNEWFLTSSYIPWYGVYNFLLGSNTRNLMALTPRQVDCLPIQIKSQSVSELGWRYILGILCLPLMYFVSLLIPNNALYQAAFIFLGMVVGFSYRYWSLKRDEKKNGIINQFKVTHTMKIRSNLTVIYVALMIILVLFLVIFKPLRMVSMIPVVSAMISISYGSIGKIPTYKKIEPILPTSFYRWSEWGNTELIGVDDPSEGLMPVRKDG